MKWNEAGVLVVITALVLMGRAVDRTATEEEAPAGRATVKRDGVSVYYQISTTNIVVMQLMRGDVVEIHPVGTTAESKWCRGREAATRRRSGYVLCENLQEADREVGEGSRHEMERELRKLRWLLLGNEMENTKTRGK